VAVFPRFRALPLQAKAESLVAPAFFAGTETLASREALAPSRPCRAALEALYADLAPRVHRFLRDLVGDATLASDAAQETFVRAFRRVDSLPADAKLAAWVFGIARKVSLEFLRARGRALRVMAEPTSDALAEPPDVAGRSPEAELLDREALRVVSRALEHLSEDRRAVLLLRLDHGLSYDEIAELMGWSIAKVKVEIFRAREVLRATLSEYRGGVP